MQYSILRARTGAPGVVPLDPQELIRSELFSVERLDQHAESLATAQRITTKSGDHRRVVKRLRDNSRVLIAAYRALAAAIREDRAITPAAEWLVDNFHIAEEQIREIRDDLSPGFYRQLPKLADGPLAGYPRVFGLAWAYVAHTDSRFDPQSLCRFVRAYQRVQPLTIGELWAVAITLRILLVENLRRSAERIVNSRVARQEADALADRLLGVDNRPGAPTQTVLRAFEQAPLPTAFAVQLVQRLREQDPAVTPTLHWLNERLAIQGTTADEIVREEHQQQGAMNVTVRNVITSMRLVSEVDWAELFESVSLVDVALRAESNFAAMDFATRDRYRGAIERLARGSAHSELAVVARAIAATKVAPHGDGDDNARERDPGYYLLARGRREFERQLEFHVPMADWLARASQSAGIVGYAAAIALITGIILSLAVFGAAHAGVAPTMLVVLAVLALVPASDLAVALANHSVTNRFGATALPGLALREGVPAELRTMIVVPTLLTTETAIEEQIERLEVHYLANADGDLRFALLSDWTDSSSEHAPGDDELLSTAAAAIDVLNRRHGGMPDGDRFLLLHRRRLWNDSEGKWIAWERKRGKLHELNRLLRGATDTTFLPIGGQPPTVPDSVRYVITLDADTRLTRGSAKRLVGKMAHPLNRPQFDAKAHRVTDGYGVLQPRVTPTLPTGREGSVFQRVFSGPGGMDPYTFAVSDVYQDLLGEGSYTGKGIYDVDIFEAALEGRIPDNTLLSHDLIEGVFARAGLVSDIEVVEEFPSRYDVSAARQHRWARGDWQLLPWIVGHGRNKSNDVASRAIPFVGRWKMADNLRRTLSAPSAFLALLAGWTQPLAAAATWSACLLAMIALPALLPVLAGLVPRRPGFSKRSHLLAVAADLVMALSQIAFVVTLLAHQAWLMTDAIGRTLLRLFVTRRHMLEWLTAAQSKFSLPLDIAGFYQRMAGGVALAILTPAVVATTGHGAWLLVAPFTLLWLLAPVVAQWGSRPPPIAGPTPLSLFEVRTLRHIARRTWRYFETFVTSDNNNLPPDNFQEDPKPVVAHRTSPTNIGLYLLSIVAARDFGWLGVGDTLDRLDATLATMQRLERFRGHFYNWYDTHDLRPLDPKYISSVDSGNLAGHLIALANACREMLAAPVLGRQWLAGIEDGFELTRESLVTRDGNRRTQIVTVKQLDDALAALATLMRPAFETPGAAAVLLGELAQRADTVADMVRALSDERSDGACDEALTWATATCESIAGHRRDLNRLMPWARLTIAPKGAGDTSPEDAVASCFLTVPTLAELPERCEHAIQLLSRQPREDIEINTRRAALIAALEHSAENAGAIERHLVGLATAAQNTFDAMEFGFLFDSTRQLLSIGYQIAEGRLDPSCYDLLASEARLASFIAIAKGDIPARHWFRLGRSLTPVDRGSALISWSGSMFEYLMPSLVMRAPLGSLLEQTSRLIVRRQVKYGAERGVPWGVSESAYNARDLELTYQYSNFGVPGLGLKRGLGEDAVIAPYATALAAMVDPQAATDNFASLTAAGGRGRFGFYEALDYTPTRVPEGTTVAIVRAHMAHHQGMALVAIGNTLHDGIMRNRFHAEPIIQATELLLQERTPRGVAVARPRAEEVKAAADVREIVPPMPRRFHSPHDPIPRTHLLSNGRYVVMLTAAGSGYSRCRDLAVTRWREDATCDAWGSYTFLRDVRTGEVWSAGYQPSGVEPDSYEVEFSEDRAVIVRRDGTITTSLEVTVSPEDDAEVRRVSISNFGSRAREIDLTSYAEVVLAQSAADAAHPAFSKLFVQTEFVADVGALLATRRRRAPDESEVWAAHFACVDGESVGGVQFETDRSRFLGRGHTIRKPVSVMDGRPLSDTVGTVLDPIFSLRRRIRLAPGATARVAFWTVIAASREAVLDSVDRHLDTTAFERVGTLAWTQAQVQLHHLGVHPDEAHLFQRLANRVIYSDPSLRPSPAVLGRNDRGQSTLWSQGISGDLPIVLIRIDAVEELEIVRQLLRAHEYWRMKQLDVDLVIMNERSASYSQDLLAPLEALIRASQTRERLDSEGARGNVFLVRADLVSLEVRTLLATAARAVLYSRRGSLAEQVKRLQASDKPALASPARPLRRPAFPLLSKEGGWGRSAAGASAPGPALPELEFFNGLGGFSTDGREYVTVLGEGQWTPAPWLNVIANAQFGFQVSADGSGYTWAVNSREHQLTPWSNDPVADQPGEVIYVRDEETGALWTPTALPIRAEAGTYIVHHGQGYTRFEHTSHGITLELLQYVPLGDPVKISRLTIRNTSGRARRLSVTAYAEWVLGTSRGASAPLIITEIEADTGALLARNPWSNEFGGRVAFVDMNGRQRSWTGDRTEFLGRNGAIDHPAALSGDAQLSHRVGGGLDPCGALQAPVELKANGSAEIVFFLGEAATRTDAIELIKRYRGLDLDVVLGAVHAHWDDILGTVQVKTPDRSMDLMLNRWLLYQTLSCRVVARSAFYQASGAYGFRDQTQDVLALLVSQPGLTRGHLLRAAGRQFAEGDVQHWWLPSSGQGVRTRISDDHVWLAYAVAHYVAVTGDTAVLDESIAFLEGPALREDEHDAYFQPMIAEEHASLFEHCARALDRSLAVGVHGLPLMGTGDWNDGMNRVGEGGRGESVWLGWFLQATLVAFAPLADACGDATRAATWRQQAATLTQSLERESWDGNWYRRGYFDDGTPLGSASSIECRIDSIAQSWAVISGAGDPARAVHAMAAVDEYLVRRAEGLVQLFSPPFDHTTLEPGYIKGYPPGIRENGGQYTHAATWSVIAFAMLGDGDKAGELFAMLNPINHAATRAASNRYKVEPYVVSADIYSMAPHVGRGGWTWYTGAAGWMYRAGLESILGFRLRGTALIVDPCVPKTWRGFELTFHHGSTRYEIAIENPNGVNRGVVGVQVDGSALSAPPQGYASVALGDDGLTHQIRIVLG